MIRSILDTDMYKLTMAQAVMEKFPRATAKYRFFNRDPSREITPEMIDAIQGRVFTAARLRLTDDEHDWLARECPYLKPWFLGALRGAWLNPAQVLVADDDITVSGPWHSAILWEVPLLAIISEVCMTWPDGATPTHVLDEVFKRTRAKVNALAEAGCWFADFGTRRRFSSMVHDRVATQLVRSGSCVGTSNVHLARARGLAPVGTMAHEWVQGVSGLVGLRHASRSAMEMWAEVYRGRLGIALTDTFGTAAFWTDFGPDLARLYDGVRQDSGDAAVFGETAVEEYERRDIDPATKTIVFSDGLDVEQCAALQTRFAGRIKTIYGIGTNLTCDVRGHPPMNIVVKLVEVDGIPVVKLSDSPGKVLGDEEAVMVARWTFGLEGEDAT